MPPNASPRWPDGQRVADGAAEHTIGKPAVEAQRRWGVGTRAVIRVNGMSQVPPNSPPPPPPGGPSGWPAPPGSQGQDRPAGGSQAPGQPPVAQGAAGYFVPVGQPPEDITGLRYQTGMTIFLSIITVGVWAAIWTYRTKEDLKRYNGDGLGASSASCCTSSSPSC